MVVPARQQQAAGYGSNRKDYDRACGVRLEGRDSMVT